VTLHSAESVHMAIERRFRSAKVNGLNSQNVTHFPFAAAETAMRVVGPVLEERDARIAVLEELAREVMAKLVPHLVVEDEVVERWKAVVSGAVQAQKLSDEKEPGS
jgi:hypothetical protein